MQIEILKSKIHNAIVTDAQLEYEGSITIDEEIYTKAGMYLHEKVLVVNLNNGQRFETYIIKGPKGSGVICLNGAAAQLAYKGDTIIIMSFSRIEEKEAASFQPVIVHLDKNNRLIKE
ncbi:MAG: aspartate 1-decarboxylase [bacterium]|nr:aspartate 1-decarboxylase [bacterium]